MPVGRTPAHVRVRLAAVAIPRRIITNLAVEERHGRAFLGVPVAIGAGAATWFCLARDPSLHALLACLFLASAMAFVCRYRSGVLRYGSAAAALFVAGMLVAEFEAWRKATILLDSAVTTRISGSVERREVDGNGNWRYVVRLVSTTDPQLRRPPERVSLLARNRHQPLEIGAGIEGLAHLAPPSGPALKGLTDFAFASYFDGIGAVGYFYGAPRAASLDGDIVGGVGLASWIDALGRGIFALRNAIGDRIRATLPGDTGAFAAAIVTDERRAISKEATAALRLSGLAHIVAISGLNMALAAGIFFVGMRSAFSLSPAFAQAYPIKKFAAFGALLTVTAYFLISGFAVSAERAFLMMVIMLAAVFVDRPSISLRNVALAAIVMVLIAPSEILGPSFQMSFAATLALVAGYALWQERPLREHPLATIAGGSAVIMVWRFIAGVFTTSVLGGLSTAMFTVDHFHHLTTYGLAANLAAMPVISFIVMPFALVSMLLMPFGLDWLALPVMGLGIDFVLWIAHGVAGWGGEVAIGRLHPLFLPIAVTGFLLLTLLRTRIRLVGVAVGAGAILLVAVDQPYQQPDLIVSEDGRLVALVSENSVSSNRRRPPDFIFSQWQRALRLGDHRAPEMLSPPVRRKSDGAGNRQGLSPAEAEAVLATMLHTIDRGEEGRFHCSGNAWCLATARNGLVIVTVEDLAFLGVACDAADLVIAARRPRFEPCRSGARLLTPAILRQTGALEIALGEQGTLSLLANAGGDADRPWTRHRFYDWKTASFERRPLEEIAAALEGRVSGSGE